MRTQRVIEPGFGLMDGEFVHYIAKIDHICRRFYVHAGILSGWRKMSDYRWDVDRERWVHRDLPINVEP